jgi:hypothetical protein
MVLVSANKGVTRKNNYPNCLESINMSMNENIRMYNPRYSRDIAVNDLTVQKTINFTYTYKSCAANRSAVLYYHHFNPKQSHLMQGHNQLLKGRFEKNEDENINEFFGEVKWEILYQT